MTEFDVDWDAGTENAYEQYVSHTRGDLCELCGNDLVAEGEDFCRSCIDDLEIVGGTDRFDVEAYEIFDPKHPDHHDVMAALADRDAA